MTEENGHDNGNTQQQSQRGIQGKRLDDIHSVVHNFKPLFFSHVSADPIFRHIDLRGYEMHEYADLWVYKYKAAELPAYWAGYVHWFGTDLDEAGEEVGFQHSWTHSDGGWIYAWDRATEATMKGLLPDEGPPIQTAEEAMDHTRSLCESLVRLSQAKLAAETDPHDSSSLAEWGARRYESEKIVRRKQGRVTQIEYERLGGLMDIYDELTPHPPGFLP